MATHATSRDGWGRQDEGTGQQCQAIVLFRSIGCDRAPGQRPVEGRFNSATQKDADELTLVVHTSFGVVDELSGRGKSLPCIVKMAVDLGDRPCQVALGLSRTSRRWSDTPDGYTCAHDRFTAIRFKDDRKAERRTL